MRHEAQGSNPDVAVDDLFFRKIAHSDRLLATGESPQPLASVLRHVMEYRGEFSSKAMHHALAPAPDANQGAHVSDSKSDTRSRCLGLSQDIPPNKYTASLLLLMSRWGCV